MSLTNQAGCSTFVLWQTNSKPIETALISAKIMWSSAHQVSQMQQFPLASPSNAQLQAEIAW
jgi:hypothetical protein